ncbi:FxsA family protein [Phytoactinopolyspora limicola]|uniref:FxsA family protein n=1 Tax=Phytoactinopolyspora limicola TaxID=2715536 RepID=UPI001407F71F|nr:FxsA family protein [Phytoactinopolyspora limicola]
MSQDQVRRRRRRTVGAFAPFLGGVLEIVVFVAIGQAIGFGLAIILALATSVIGLWLMRRAGFNAWRSLRAAAADAARVADANTRNPLAPQDGPTPQERIADAGVTLLAGTVLVFPGFITDAAALLLLVPPVRRKVGRRLAAAALRTLPTPTGRGPASGGDVVEGEVVPDSPIRDQLSADPEERDS